MQNNPFLIDIEDKEEYSLEEYKDIQKKISEKNIDEILNSYYPPADKSYKYEDFKDRCTNGFRQKIIDIDIEQLPQKNLYTIGNGGNNKNCIVCCTSLAHAYTDSTKSNSRYNASQNIVKSLEEVGFNGHAYILNGGFPNPTGTEMKYIGVPYCFKIFMMLEAKKIGFKNVIWIDSSCYAINNPQELFDILDNEYTLCFTYPSGNNYNGMSFKETIGLLNSITNTNLHDASYIMTIVFGLNMDSEIIMKMIDDYYDMVKLGLPFLSIFPEEIVLSSIFNKPEYRNLLPKRYINDRLQIHEHRLDIDSARQNGYFFYHRKY
jgi:hypothetical protein